MAFIKVNVDSKPVAARLKALVDADREPIFKVIGNAIADKVRLCFKLGTDPWGTKWAPLKYRRGQPLSDTRRLRGSITMKADQTGATIGTNVEYAPYHQYGAQLKQRNQVLAFGKKGRFISRQKASQQRTGAIKVAFAKVGGGVIPARPFLPIKPDDKTIKLPPAWSKDVVLRLRAHFKKVGQGKA